MLALVLGKAETQLQLLKLLEHGSRELLSQHVHVGYLLAFRVERQVVLISLHDLFLLLVVDEDFQVRTWLMR